MKLKLPLKFYVDADTLQRMNQCSHISKQNEFDPGVLCHPVEHCEVVKASDMTFGLCAGFTFAAALFFCIGLMVARLPW